MRIGIISDIHGCLVGLEAALEWLKLEGVDSIVCAGDVANFGPQPDECISLLVEWNIPSVQGNCDRDLLLPIQVDRNTDARTRQLNEINNWCRENISAASRQWLAALPPQLMPVPGVLVVHGSLEDPEKIIDVDARPSFPTGVSTVVAGHLHKPFIMQTKRGVWVNAGSTGRPCDGDPRAALAVLERQQQGWVPSIHRIPFDLEIAADAIRRTNMPYAERLIETQKAACWW
jgi:predicted phosphodiesterase